MCLLHCPDLLMLGKPSILSHPCFPGPPGIMGLMEQGYCFLVGESVTSWCSNLQKIMLRALDEWFFKLKGIRKKQVMDTSKLFKLFIITKFMYVFTLLKTLPHVAKC